MPFGSEELEIVSAGVGFTVIASLLVTPVLATEVAVTVTVVAEETPAGAK